MYSFSYLTPVCSKSRSNCCFLTCIQVSQEAGQVVWYPHLFQNFPQFIVIHTVKDFSIVNDMEVDFFSLEFPCCFDNSADVGNLISASSAFSKTSLNIWKFTWYTGEGNGKTIQYSCLENSMNSMKRQKDRTLKDELPRSVVPNMLLEVSGEITPERMKR